MPDKFSNAPGKPMGFNAKYFGDVMKLAAKFTANSVVKQQMNSNINPAVFSFDIEQFWLGGQLMEGQFRRKEWSCDYLTAEVLVMPVQFRD